MNRFKLFLVAMIIGLVAGCTDADNAVKVLHGAGYSEVYITGYSWFACSQDDTFATGFKAKGPSGLQVEGAVCSGWLIKNSTIRSN